MQITSFSHAYSIFSTGYWHYLSFYIMYIFSLSSFIIENKGKEVAIVLNLVLKPINQDF